MKKVVHRFRNAFYNKMCKNCRGFNNGENTHCAWCGEDLFDWNIPKTKDKKFEIVKNTKEYKEAVKRAEEESLKDRKFDWGF